MRARGSQRQTRCGGSKGIFAGASSFHALFLGMLLLPHVLSAADSPSRVTILAHGDGFQLTRNGEPYFIKGACANSRLDELAAAGGNSVRTFSPRRDVLDVAQAKGLTVMLGLNVGSPRHGFDYSDTDSVSEQLKELREQVRTFKNHPALLIWAIGNEPELSASKDDRILVWKAINQIAEMIHAEDSEHPAITVLAGTGGGKLRELAIHCPALDAVGINTYAGATSLPATIAGQGWKRPWLLTEFGPRGHWEVGKTPWGMPIEDSSTLKAELYLKAYQRAVERQLTCLGSYVFLWGQKQEKTHTWYGMFLPEGNRLGPVDAMTMAWAGKWPTNRCPQISREAITAEMQNGTGGPSRQIYPGGTRLRCTVAATDPDGDALAIRWELRPDVADNPSSGGDQEELVAPLEGAVVEATNLEALIQLPEQDGNFRVFVYALDPLGSAATANLPVQVKSQ